MRTPSSELSLKLGRKFISGAFNHVFNDNNSASPESVEICQKGLDLVLQGKFRAAAELMKANPTTAEIWKKTIAR